jgi:pyruvate dehydrogenase E2 component (dihydrolipoamide acetyltransferase)
MAQIITMPRLSDTMTEGVVATWLKKVGDTIKTGDILAEIETDKATMEFESFYDGVLLHIGIQEGQSASVDSLLAVIGKTGEDISALLASGTAAKAEKVVEEVNAVASSTAEIPANVKIITMPRLSDTMTTGTVATWLKKVGDTVKEGDILAEIETDKATMEFESFNAGTLLYIGIQI